MQKSRFEDQRCDFKTTTHETGSINTLRGQRKYSLITRIIYCLSVEKIKGNY